MAENKKNDEKKVEAITEAVVKEATSPTPAEVLKTMSPEKQEMVGLIKAIMMEVLPAVMAVKSAPEMREAKQREALAEAKLRARKLCAVCRQPVSACEDKHEHIEVFPSRYPEFADGFPGVTINGVTYLSAFNKTVPVPASCAPYIRKIVQGYEDNMRQSIMGRKATHNSGHIDGTGESRTQTHNATVGWR